jgi:hypothetical protein
VLAGHAKIPEVTAVNHRLLVVHAYFLLISAALGSQAVAAPSTVEPLSPEIYVVRDDAGMWGGMRTGITHQHGPDYWAKKMLDLTAVPENIWKASSRARLSVFFAVCDYSWHDAKTSNGLDEAFEMVVNGKAHRVANNSDVPVYEEHQPPNLCFRWHDFEIPKDELVRGPNEIIFRLVIPEGKTPDDYLYLGIDNTVPGRNSWVRFGKGDAWRQDRITVPDGGTGEYMVRLHLFSRQKNLEATWHATGPSEDRQKLFAYAGSHSGQLRIEWDPKRFDRLSPMTIVVETADARPFDLHWLDAQGSVAAGVEKARGPRYESTHRPPLATASSGVLLAADVAVKSIRLSATEDFRPLVKPVDMCPLIRSPKGRAAPRGATCTIESNTIRLSNANLRCQFRRAGGKLRLVSLWNEMAAAEMARRPDDCALWLVEVQGKRYAGSREFVCQSIKPMEAKPGFRAVLACPAIGLEATLSVWIDDELRMGLSVTNRTAKPVNFKLAFPHLAGLALSDDPAGDYYYFPWGGGIISDAPAIIRRGYGDHAALYQLMDLFSPSRGAGLAVRSTDEDGRHKVLALRKYTPGSPESNGDAAETPTTDEFKWTNSLAKVPGLSVAYEYLRRTRGPGETFAAKDAAIRAHAGDWHVALRAYADWCHRVWKFRPYPSRLTSVVSMVSPGWGQDALFRDGKYRSDFLSPRSNCVELMSWWDWSPVGPWGTPLDQFVKKWGEAKQKTWEPYFAKDPVSGRMMFNNNPGDYDGYNQRWGGLPAFRKAVRSYQRTGTLVTLYTDPMRVDGASRCGQKYGKLWGVVNADGKYFDAYDCWRMCLDVDEYRKWTAETIRRVMRETGADGIRLDEHGHGGSACFSKSHRHTFAEWGNTEWLRATAESAKLVRQAMDEVAPRSILMTEHPGYDFLLPFMEGCITYDLSVQATELRPVECNTQRFYFPECKAYELVYDQRRGDGNHYGRFWNAVGDFGSPYPSAMYNVLRENNDVFASRDCEPLVPTLARRVYANRFQAGDRTFYTLLNATGHSFFGPVLALNVRPGEHVFDLLRGRDAEIHHGREGAAVQTFLLRDAVTCLATMPARLTVKRTGHTIEAVARNARPAWQIRVCDAEGNALLSATVGAKAKLNLADLGAKAKAALYVKLMDGPRLVDAAALAP